MGLQGPLLLVLPPQGGFALLSTPRLNVLNLENIRVSWQLLRGGELVLNLYSKVVLRFPG